MYRPGTYWWDIYELLRKLLLTGIIVLVFPGTIDQVAIAFLFHLLYLMNLLIQNPHNQGPTRNASMQNAITLTITMYIGLLFKASPKTAEKYYIILDTILISTNGLCTLYTLYHVVPIRICIAVIKARKEKKKRQQEEREKKRRRSLLPSTEQDRAHHVVQTFDKKKVNMAQIVPKPFSENLDFALPSEEVIHEITDEDRHNSHINGVKGPHES